MVLGDFSNPGEVLNLGDFLNPIDRDALRNQVRCSTPVPNFLIDNFLRQDFAERVVDAFPPYEQAIAVGRSFRAVNEKGKVQVTDSSRFPEPIRQLNHVLAAARRGAAKGATATR